MSSLSGSIQASDPLRVANGESGPENRAIWR
jgi:hypothetical protein